MIDETAARRASRSTWRGSRRTSSSASRVIGEFTQAERARRTAQGDRAVVRAGRRGRPAAARRGTSIRRVERLQVKVRGMTDPRHVDHLQRPQACRCIRPASQGEYRRRRALPRLAAAELPAPDDPGRRAAGVRRARHVDGPLARRLHVPRRPPGRAEPRDVSRSTPSRPKAAGRPGSSRWAIAAADSTSPRDEPNRDFPLTLDLRRGRDTR